MRRGRREIEHSARRASNILCRGSGSAVRFPAQRWRACRRKHRSPASQTGGFDGGKAYDHVAKLVSFGPHAIRLGRDSRHAGTTSARSFAASACGDRRGRVPCPDSRRHPADGRTSLPRFQARGQGIILLLTHYDTKRLDNFVGADDGGLIYLGLMLPKWRAILYAAPKQPNAVWIRIPRRGGGPRRLE